MGIFRNLKNERENRKRLDTLKNWTLSASDQQLEEAWTKRWEKWAADGYGGPTGRKTDEMLIIEEETSKRAVEKFKKSPGYNPNFRWTDANRWDKD